jgi:uncharacterized membrane protein
MEINVSPHQPHLEKPIPSRWLQEWSGILLISFLAIGLRLYQLGTESLWLDEIFSITHTLNGQGLPPTNLMRPVYYVLLKLWVLLGTNEAWMRSLAVVFGVGSVFLLYCLGCRFINKSTGLLAATLLALSPFALDQSQEVRMYPLGLFLSLAGTFVLFQILEQANTRILLCWAGLRWLMILTTPLNATLLLSDTLLVLLKFHQRRPILLAYGKWLFLLCGLWSLSFIQLLQRTPDYMSSWVATRSKPSPIEFLGIHRVFLSHSPSEPMNYEGFYEIFLKLLLMVLIGLVTFALFYKPRSEKFLWVAISGYVPLAAIFVISHITSSIWLPRYLSFTSPYLLLLIAAGWLKLWNQHRKIAIPIALAYIVTISVGLTSYYTTLHRANWRDTTQLLNAQAAPADAIALFPPSEMPVLRYYYQGSATISAFLDDGVAPDLDSIKQQICQLGASHEHLWLIVQTGYAAVSESYQQWIQTLQNMIEQDLGVQNYQSSDGVIKIYSISPSGICAAPSLVTKP